MTSDEEDMAAYRCLSYTPRLGQFICVFLLGAFVGRFLLGDNQSPGSHTSLREIQRRHPNFKCVEVSPDDNIDELGAGLDAMESPAGIHFDPISHLLESRHRDGKSMLPDVTRSGRRTMNSGLLSPERVTNVVHYLWCEMKIFEFQHYLSVWSVVHHINPERIIFHYVQYPRHDIQYYNTWFEDMKQEFYYVEIEDKSSTPEICHTTQSQMQYMTSILRLQGGIYVHFNTFFVSFPASFRLQPVTDGLTNDLEGFMVVRQGVPLDRATKTKHVQCLPAQDFQRKDSGAMCVIKKGPYHPSDVWGKTDDFSREVNMLMYGSQETPTAPSSDQDLIPNIGHVYWADGEEVSFLFYLNCLSFLYVLKVERLFVHGNTEPSGRYWDSIKAERNVTFVRISKPSLILRKHLEQATQMSHVFRADVLLRYGGIFADSNSVWIKPIPEELRRYDVVASLDWPHGYNMYPQYANFGALLSRPDADFWHYYLHSYKDFKAEMSDYNSFLRPYKVIQRHPDLVHMDAKLQVACYDLLCHPTWYPDFRKKNVDHHSHPDFDWRDAYSFRWTDSTPIELTDTEELRHASSMFAEIGKHVLKAAGRQP